MMTLPVQEGPSPVNPSLHSQAYELMVSIHVAFLLQVFEIHSSISKKFNINFIDKKYIWEVSSLTGNQRIK